MGRAAQRLGVQAAFWNLRYGERYDVTHPANLRRLLRDIANGEVLSCLMSVPSTGWNEARGCSRPLRSSAQPWGIEKSRVLCHFQILACLDTSNRIMRAVIELARQYQRSNVPWAIENPEKCLCGERTCVTCVLTQGSLHTSCGIVLTTPTGRVDCYRWVVLWPMHSGLTGSK